MQPDGFRRCWKLFRGVPLSELNPALEKIIPRERNFSSGAVVALEDEPCQSIGVIIHGAVEMQRLQSGGGYVVMEAFSDGESFGEAIVFSERDTYPATIMAVKDSRICFLSREDVLALCGASPTFLTRFISHLSNRILMLNSRVKSLSLPTVRQKVAHFILEQYNLNHTLRIETFLSRAEMALRIGLPRPSLSREMAALKQDGLIDFDRNSITILDLERLEGV